MYRILTPIFLLFYLVAGAQQKELREFPLLELAKNVPHIAYITSDSIIVVKGSTYRYSVDTHEDSGLVSTATTVKDLLHELGGKNLKVLDQAGNEKIEGLLGDGDRLRLQRPGNQNLEFHIGVRPYAVGGKLNLVKNKITSGTKTDLTLEYTVGQRTPNATVKILVPWGFEITTENTTVNVIGRGAVKLNELSTQYTGRAAAGYPHQKVGDVSVTKQPGGKTLIVFQHLDLRPANGPDLVITIPGVSMHYTGSHLFQASYSTTQPEVLNSTGNFGELAWLTVTSTISDLERIVDKSMRYRENANSYSKVDFRWSKLQRSGNIKLLQSLDSGKTWTTAKAVIDTNKATASISGLCPKKLYAFKLHISNINQGGNSNIVYYYSGKKDIKDFGVSGDGKTDDTEKINMAIAYMNEIGGGSLHFTKGIYNVRTVHLKSNVYLYVDKEATIQAMKGGDAPETAWFSDKKYRSGLSPTDRGPYADPENWMTKQDVGHTYFRNCMFFGERVDNVKIIGNGYITGNGNLVTGDRVMNNAPGNRCDKMFTFKLCTNIEIGGIYREDDLWYDSAKDEPYYIKKDGSKDFNTGNMLQIDRGGHFVLLATGTDDIYVHDTYFAKQNQSNARDIYDFMQCNRVTAMNIYSKVSSDDIVKPGSDCSLGFTRKAANHKVRNVIGDTNCNLFQIGSETADDITEICVDNIYVLGANKAGFSISTNDGGHIKNIHLNCGHTGKLHSRSKMYRTFSPFFISISNRGRILGAKVERYKFNEGDTMRDELLVTNVNIGKVENIIINSIDVGEVYSGSSFGGSKTRWKAFDGSQRRATPIVAGYSLPEPAKVQGGLNFTLPDGNHTGYIQNIVFNDVRVLVKGGNQPTDTAAAPPELGVGQYNVSNLKVQPAYGLWVRHAKKLTVINCNFTFEKPDGRYAIYLDDVLGATIRGLKTTQVVKQENSKNISIN